MGWDRKTELVLVIACQKEAANAYMRARRGLPDRFYAWAPRWSCVVGWNPANTTFVTVGEWWTSDECEKSYFWLKDRGFRERYD